MIDIDQLIASNQLEKAIEMLENRNKNRSLQNDVVFLKQKYNDLQTKKRRRLLDPTNESVQSYNLVNDILELKDKIEQSATSVPIATQKQTKPKTTNVLFLYSCPENKSQLNFGKEIKSIRRALKGTSNPTYKFIVEEAVEADELFHKINQHHPQIIHISAHSSLTKGLLFQDQNGIEMPVNNRNLSYLFKLISEKNKTIDCIILNACNSSKTAKLLKKYARFTIGHHDFIPDEAALEFTKHFYQAIFKGETINFAFKAAVLAIKLLDMEPEGKIAVDKIPRLFD